MEQVAADLRMELIFSEKGVPRGRGKVERFFRSVDQLFLQDVPGYAPKGYQEAEATLTLPDFEQRFRKWLLQDYHHRVHSETEYPPLERSQILSSEQRDRLSAYRYALQRCHRLGATGNPLARPDAGRTLYSCGKTATIYFAAQVRA